MDLKEIYVNMRNWVDMAQGLLERPYECGIKHPGSISHGVSKLTILFFAAHFPVPEGYFEEDDSLVGVPGKRGGETSNDAKAMWFGPRLGKRSRRGAEFPWAVVTVKGKYILILLSILFLNRWEDFS